MKVLPKIFKDLRTYRRKIVTALIFSVIMAGLGLVGPYVYKILTDQILAIIDGSVSIQAVGQSIIIVLIAWAVADILFFLFEKLFYSGTEYISSCYSRDLTLKAFNYVQNLSLRFHVQSKSGSVMKKIDRAGEAAWQVSAAILSDIIAPMISFGAISIVIFLENWKLAIVAVVTVPIYIIVTYFVTKKIANQQEAVNKRWEKAFGSAYDAMTNIEAVKAYSGENYEQKKVGRQMTKTYAGQYQVARLWINSSFYRNLLFVASQIGVFGMGVYLAVAGEITVGTIVLFVGYLAKMHAPLYQLTSTYSKVHQGLTSLKRVYDLMEITPEIKDLPRAPALSSVRGEVIFDKVSFGYRPDKMILKNISLRVPAGKVIAIVGPSGVGKSTLVNLINRFYDPLQGRILIDGVDIKTVQQHSLREQIGIVTQENILFNDTILNNIAYGDIDPQRVDVDQAVRIANLDQVIAKLPRRYQTLVGERGVRLSGGEKQRVSIARAVLKNPPILILDEATSHLDSESEKLVQDALWKLIKGRTTFIIAHRLSTIRRADEIIVLKDGGIAERGRHQDLVHHNGLYQALYSLQSSGEISAN
jgi:ABC-type multidrug transport system fused ATPase/permease subunit